MIDKINRMKKQPRHRWATPTRKGRWHDTAKAAREAAARAGLGSIDPVTKRVYIDVLVTIESDAGKVIK